MEIMRVENGPNADYFCVGIQNRGSRALRIAGVQEDSDYKDPIAITSTDDNYDFLWLSGKKPYFINIAYIECVVGEWNKDRTQCGVRIFLRSGNSVWTADGEDVLGTLYGDDAAEFFKKVAAKGDD